MMWGRKGKFRAFGALSRLKLKANNKEPLALGQLISVEPIAFGSAGSSGSNIRLRNRGAWLRTLLDLRKQVAQDERKRAFSSSFRSAVGSLRNSLLVKERRVASRREAIAKGLDSISFRKELAYRISTPSIIERPKPKKPIVKKPKEWNMFGQAYRLPDGRVRIGNKILG